METTLQSDQVFKNWPFNASEWFIIIIILIHYTWELETERVQMMPLFQILCHLGRRGN